MITAYKSEVRSFLAIILLKIQRVILWACLDTGSARNFISREAIKKLSRKPKRHESRQFVTINGVQKESMPIFEVRLDSLNNRTSEQVEITETKMEDYDREKTDYDGVEDKIRTRPGQTILHDRRDIRRMLRGLHSRGMNHSYTEETSTQTKSVCSSWRLANTRSSTA